MQSKFFQILILVLVVSVVYSLLIVFSADEPYSNSEYNDSSLGFEPEQQNTNTQTRNSQTMPQSSLPAPSSQSKTQKNNEAKQTKETVLPLKFLVLGAKQAKETTEESKTLISHQGNLSEYTINDYILNSDMYLVNITDNNIQIDYEGTLHTISVTPPNMLADNYREPEKTYAEFLEMTPDEIGSRPRIIEHLVILTPTPYIADGRIINPGLNPKLFAQAGFKEDDVLKTINGKSVTIESEFEEIKKELKNAHTLKFTVMRKGRMITLYLDIPSEELEIKMF